MLPGTSPACSDLQTASFYTENRNISGVIYLRAGATLLGRRRRANWKKRLMIPCRSRPDEREAAGPLYLEGLPGLPILGRRREYMREIGEAWGLI